MAGHIQPINSARGQQTVVDGIQPSFPVDMQKHSQPQIFQQIPTDLQHETSADLEKVSTVEPGTNVMNVAPKICRKCRQEGHYRIECQNEAFCTICAENGHQNRSHQKRLKRLRQCEANSFDDSKKSSLLQPEVQKSEADDKTVVKDQRNQELGTKTGTVTKCFNCGGANHKSTQCTNSPFCGICKESGHTNKQHRSQLAQI